ncbi:MAG: hypothetical protein HYV60_17565 [Planctomycetia bacterium]|nr:hypothetical protein [Planctomycetia bacterium]
MNESIVVGGKRKRSKIKRPPRPTSSEDPILSNGIKATAKLGKNGDLTGVVIQVNILDDLVLLVTDPSRQRRRDLPISICMESKDALRLAASICQQIADRDAIT